MIASFYNLTDATKLLLKCSQVMKVNFVVEKNMFLAEFLLKSSSLRHATGPRTLVILGQVTSTTQPYIT